MNHERVTKTFEIQLGDEVDEDQLMTMLMLTTLLTALMLSMMFWGALGARLGGPASKARPNGFSG